MTAARMPIAAPPFVTLVVRLGGLAMGFPAVASDIVCSLPSSLLDSALQPPAARSASPHEVSEWASESADCFAGHLKPLLPLALGHLDATRPTAAEPPRHRVPLSRHPRPRSRKEAEAGRGTGSGCRGRC